MSLKSPKFKKLDAAVALGGLKGRRLRVRAGLKTALIGLFLILGLLLAGSVKAEKKVAYYNFATGKIEYRQTPPATDAEGYQYIPQDQAVRFIYDQARRRGKSVLEAIGEACKYALEHGLMPKVGS
jgi:hypothetical protein